MILSLILAITSCRCSVQCIPTCGYCIYYCSLPSFPNIFCDRHANTCWFFVIQLTSYGGALRYVLSYMASRNGLESNEPDVLLTVSFSLVPRSDICIVPQTIKFPTNDFFAIPSLPSSFKIRFFFLLLQTPPSK